MKFYETFIVQLSGTVQVRLQDFEQFVREEASFVSESDEVTF